MKRTFILLVAMLALPVCAVAAGWTISPAKEPLIDAGKEFGKYRDRVGFVPYASFPEQNRMIVNRNDSIESVSRFIDPETGCHYLLFSHGGMTMRMGVDGKQICTT